MTWNERNPEILLDEAVAGIRDEPIDPRLEQEAAQKLLSRLRPQLDARSRQTSESIRGCADYQALIPVYLAGKLPDARRILFEDHVRHCIPCRKAMREARNGKQAAARPTRGPSWTDSWGKWALAAAVVIIAIGLTQLGILDQFLPKTTSGQASVQSVTGTLMRVSENGSSALAAGTPIGMREELRTAKATRSKVTLGDGSVVEVSERSEFSISEARDGITFNLNRGNIIVKAADQGSGHLYVRTQDCTVAVKGTIFSVVSGPKGSRVSVLEGEVWVEQGQNTKVLKPGMQYTTSERLAGMPLEHEVAWSQDVDVWTRLIKTAKVVGKDINRALFPGMRFSSRFLDVVPADTVIYAAVPNVGTGLAEAQQIFMQRVASNPALKQWWDQSLQGSGGDATPFQIIDWLREFGARLGEEIVVSASQTQAGDLGHPLVLAEVVDAAGLRQVIQEQVPAEAHFVLVEDPAAATPSQGEVYIWITNDAAAAAPSLETLRQFQTDWQGGSSAFAATQFHETLSEAYLEGVDWLFAADAERLLAPNLAGDSATFAARAGLLDIRHFVVEARERDGEVESRAMMTFSQPRHGIVSWLASPAPIGALEFVSADANVAAAFAVKEPILMFQDILDLFSNNSDVLAQLSRLEQSTGINLQDDFAASLGGEVVLALDGPLLPSPAWKLVLEVYDQDRLQRVIEALVADADRQLQDAGKKGLRMTQEVVGGHLFYSITSLDVGYAAHYTYADGYLVAAPSRSLVLDSLQFRDAGYTLPHQQEFMSLLPTDGHTGFSGVVYQNYKSVIGPLASLGAAIDMTPEQSKYLEQVAGGMGGSLICAYAEEDRIIFASRSHFGLNPGSLLGMGFGALQMQNILDSTKGR